MRCQKLTYLLVHAGKILLLLLPFNSFCQEQKTDKTPEWSYRYIQKAVQIPVVQEVLLDSIRWKMELLQQVQAAYPSGGKINAKASQALKERLALLPTAGTDPSSLLSRLPALYSLKTALPSRKNDPFSLTVNGLQGQVLYGNQLGTNDPIPMHQSWLYQSSAQVSASIAGIPFSGGFNWGFPAFFDQALHTTYKVSFKRDDYLKGLRKKLTDHFDVDKVLLNDFDFKTLFQSYAQNQLTAFRGKLQEEFGSLESLSSMAEKLSVDELLYLGKEQLQEKLFPKTWVDSLQTARATILSQLAGRVGGQGDTALQTQLTLVEEQLNGVQQLQEKLLAIKQTFETDGLNYSQLVRYQQQVNAGLQEITGSERFVQEASKNLLPIKGLSRFFLSIQELNLGQFASGWSKGSLSDQFTSGVGGSFLNKNKFLGLNLSKVQTQGWLKDNPFSTNLFDPASSLQAIRMGQGNLGKQHSHLTMINATSRNDNKIGNPYGFIPRNTFVGSFSKSLSMGSLGNLEAEVSKSANQYRNTFSSDNQLESKVAFKHFGADLWQTIALGVRYEGNFEAIDFRPKVFASYAGLGYTNPGSSLQSRGSLSYGTQLYKRFFSNRMILQSRFSKRTNQVSVEEDRKLNQLQNAFSASYRITKKVKLGVNWNYSDLSRIEEESAQTLYYSNRLSADISLNSKLSGWPLYQYTSLGFQKISIPDLSVTGQGNMLWLNSSTSLGLPKGSLTATLQLYNGLDQATGAGSLLTADLGWTYMVLKKVNITTAVNYLDQKITARQLGLRNTISTTIAGNLGFQLFADFRRDLIENQNELLFPNSRGEATITYNLK